MSYFTEEDMREYDAWKQYQPKEKKPECICDSCGCGLYEGDRFYLIDGRKICKKCMDLEYRHFV